jgi:phosphoesterase RecJ-like protein
MNSTPSNIQAIEQQLAKAQRILVVPHANIDPDCLSSALALGLMLEATGKEVTIVTAETPPSSLSFLPGFSRLTQDLQERQDFVMTIDLPEGTEVDTMRYTVEDHRVHIIVVPKRGRISARQVSLSEGEARYDLIVIVDTADLALLGSLYRDHVDFFAGIPIVNIDHHISNKQFGQLHLIDPTAASATEVLYNFFLQVPAYRERITPDIATLLLAGLITDTRSFQNPNTTPRSLEVAASLLERGARQQEIIQQIYKTKPLSTLKIWGRALNRIQMDAASRIVWSAVSREDLAEMSASSAETQGILDELISTIPDADVYVLFTETEDGGLKASLRSSAAVDVSALAGKTFGGGGHPRAAGFKVRTVTNFQLQVLECIQTLKIGLQEQRAAREDAAKSTPVASTPVSPTSPTVAPPAPLPTQGTDIVRDLASAPPRKGKNGAKTPKATKEFDVLQGLTGADNQPSTPGIAA